jgi:hypothetical protein
MTVWDASSPTLNLTGTGAVEHIRSLLAQSDADASRRSVMLPRLASDRPSLLELRGLGREIWVGVDAVRYVRGLRDEWDAD